MASDTRDRLVRATSRLLRTQGYGATGLNQVMTEADAPKGSMYFHFPGGKVELAAAAVDRFAGATSRRMRRYLDEHDSVRYATLATFGASIAHWEKTGYVEGCAGASVSVDAASAQDELAAATGRAFDLWTAMLAEALEAEGRPAGEAHNLGTLTIAALEGAIVMSKGSRTTEPLAATRETFRTILAPPA